MAWNIKISGTNFPIFVTDLERSIEPQVSIQNPVASSSHIPNISLVWTATPSQRLVLRGRLLISGITTTVNNTGPLSPGTAADSIFNLSAGAAGLWNNVNNIKVADGSVANSTYTSPFRASHVLLATNFGAAVPTTSSVTGVMAEIKERETQNLGMDGDISLYKSGVPISMYNKAVTNTNGTVTSTYGFWPLALAYHSYGGSADNWGAQLLPATVNNATFGVGLVGGYGNPSANLEVDHIRLTIYSISYSVTTSATLDIFEAAVRDGAVVDLIDDEGTDTACYLTKFQAGRIQTVATNKYSMVTLNLVKNG
jgi:hypothetical protein